MFLNSKCDLKILDYCHFNFPRKLYLMEDQVVQAVHEGDLQKSAAFALESIEEDWLMHEIRIISKTGRILQERNVQGDLKNELLLHLLETYQRHQNGSKIETESHQDLGTLIDIIEDHVGRKLHKVKEGRFGKLNGIMTQNLIYS